MPKIHNIYNQVALFTGPSPSSGYHCITNYGALNDDIPSDENFNLVFPLSRVISTSFNFDIQRSNIKQLGTEGNVSRPILNPTDILLNFSYYVNGLLNDVRLGLMATIPSGNSLSYLYGNRVCPISGLLSRNKESSNENQLGWPLVQRDVRNIFAISRKDQLDANNPTLFTPLLKQTNDFYTTAFGDCYLDSYQTQCSVGQLPQTNVKFICNNVVMYDGTSGNKIPSLITRTQDTNSGVNFYIPNDFEGTGVPTVVLPQDITLTINQSNGNVENLFNNFNDIKIQGYNIGFQLPREPLFNIGYKYPMDRVINLPVIVTVSIDTIPGDSIASSIVNLLKEDANYNLAIKLNYQGNTRYFTGTAIQYDFISAKFDGMQESLSISNRKTNTYNFSVEMKPSDNVNGFFLSGQLGIQNRTGYTTYLSGQGGSGYILDSSGELIQISTAEYIPIY